MLAFRSTALQTILPASFMRIFPLLAKMTLVVFGTVSIVIRWNTNFGENETQLTVVLGGRPASTGIIAQVTSAE